MGYVKSMFIDLFFFGLIFFSISVIAENKNEGNQTVQFFGIAAIFDIHLFSDAIDDIDNKKAFRSWVPRLLHITALRSSCEHSPSSLSFLKEWRTEE